MHKHNAPENHLKVRFSVLVPQSLLGNKRTGPTAKQFQQVKRGFGRSPLVLFRFLLIRMVAKKSNQTGP